MLFEEADRPAFKEWLIPRLEKISDADAGVLADYVLALVVAEETAEAVKQNCFEALVDFLHEHTASFLDDVLAAVKAKSFVPKAQPAVPTASKPALSAEAAPFNPPTGPSSLQQQPHPAGYGSSPEQSRKRRFNELGSGQPQDGQDPHYNRGLGAERPSKQTARRGGRNSRGGHGAQIPSGVPGGMPMPPMPNFPGLPTPPPGFPAIDPNNPMSFLTMMGMGFPGMPGPGVPPPKFMESGGPGQSKGRKKRCRNYDTKGYCALGSTCPYEHGGEIVLPPTTDGIFNSPTSTLSPMFQTPNTAFKPALAAFSPTSRSQNPTFNSPTLFPIFQPFNSLLTPPFPIFSPNSMPQDPPHVSPKPNLSSGYDTSDDEAEYDPNQASLAVQSMQGANGNIHHGRTRPHGGAHRGRTRASFSQAGPNYDQANSTIVVEQIPEENFTEEAVRGFFSQFGTIVEVEMQAYKRLAIVKYDDYFAARRAYDSPKVIFDNRFVKVYWYNPDKLPKPPKANGRGASQSAEAPERPDEDMVDPEEIEKRQAEAQKAYEERQKKAQEADARIQEIESKLQENQERMRQLREQLAKKSNNDSTDAGTLIDQLASLQSEAQGLNADYDTHSYRGRGRGGYRGFRGSFPPRARGYAPFRGGYRGRGFAASPFAHGGRSAVKRLDNRPKRISISGIEPGSKQDEALRQHLLNNYEYENIEPHPDSANTQIITFKERYMAEMFLGQAFAIPNVGKIELAWVPNAPSTTTTTKTEPSESENIPSESDAKMDDANADEQATSAAPAGEYVNGSGNGGEDNYDVADDEDRWMAA